MVRGNDVIDECAQRLAGPIAIVRTGWRRGFLDGVGDLRERDAALAAGDAEGSPAAAAEIDVVALEYADARRDRRRGLRGVVLRRRLLTPELDHLLDLGLGDVSGMHASET